MQSKKVAIGIATNRQVKPKTVQSLLDLVARGGYEFEIIVADRGFTTSENRIYIMSKALETNCNYLLFVDDDMVFPPDTLDHLMAHKKEVVGVDSKSRKLPLHTTVVMPIEAYDLDGEIKEPEMPKELFKARFVGTGVMLIDLSIIEKLDKPWFDVETFEFGMIKKGEDAYFCDKVQAVGLDVWCDPTIPIGHIGDYVYGEDYNLINNNYVDTL